MSLEHDIERGRMASEVLNNPVYAESYDRIEQELCRKWRDSRDKDEREQLHRLLLAAQLMRGMLESTMKSGQVALDKLNQQRTLAERIGLRRRSD